MNDDFAKLNAKFAILDHPYRRVHAIPRSAHQKPRVAHHQEDVDMSLRLEDIEKIRQLKYRYWRSIDTGDIAALEELFTDDVRVDYIGGSYRWQMQGRDKIIESIAQSFHANAVACHTGHHPEIEVLTDTTATGTWYLTDVFINLGPEKIRTTGSALYRDKYVKQRGQWRIAESTYERLYEEVEKFEKMPNLTAHYLKRVPPPVAKAG
jgi:uncharacterized protein (TIGR02246 family)